MSDIRWVTLAEACAELRVGERTIYNRVKSAHLQKRRNAEGRTEIGISPSGKGSDAADLGDSVHGATAGEPTVSVDAGFRSAHSEYRSDSEASIPNSAWRSDMQAQIEDLKAHCRRADEDKVHLRTQLQDSEGSKSKAATAHEVVLASLKDDVAERISSMQGTLAVRESRIAELTGQVAVLESKVREILEKGQDEALGLANRIADLVERQQTAEARIYELQPVAERVPMLEAAVDETKTLLHETEGDLVDREKKLFERERQLADLSDDIQTIASRPVAGPVFRLLTRGKLRI